MTKHQDSKVLVTSGRLGDHPDRRTVLYGKGRDTREGLPKTHCTPIKIAGPQMLDTASKGLR
jgi:hypothetical protein